MIIIVFLESAFRLAKHVDFSDTIDAHGRDRTIELLAVVSEKVDTHILCVLALLRVKNLNTSSIFGHELANGCPGSSGIALADRNANVARIT